MSFDKLSIKKHQDIKLDEENEREDRLKHKASLFLQ